ncbi:MAG: tetratricopeptide repeat protein [Eubacteriales bacterium]|nr:tetratricopeptide repeat protein [Eubacteriales bacterium]
MSGYILCQTKKAETPYFIENISTNIYSLEELCYYLYHNLYLVDKTIINEGLCTWIQEELELPRLAAKLRPHLGKFASAEDVLYPVFKEINYLSYEELRILNGQLAKLDAEAPAVREKRKGDSLVENGMYVNAIRVYEKLLQRDDLEKISDGLRENVYHNLGCACSYLFQMEKALDCFRKAYEISQSREALKSYLLACQSICTPIEYESKLTELDVEEELRQEIKEDLEHFAKRPEKEVYSRNIDTMLEEFTREYHRSTGS